MIESMTAKMHDHEVHVMIEHRICYEKCIATFFCQNNMKVCHFNKKVSCFDVNASHADNILSCQHDKSAFSVKV